MDFWEGILIGPVWSDSDIRAKSRRGTLYIVSLIWLLATLVFAFIPELQKFLWPGATITLILAIGLHLLIPFAGAYYYRLPFYLRPLVLLGYVLPYFLFLKSFSQILLAQFEIDFSTLPEQTLDFINNRIEEAARFISLSSNNNFQSTMISIIVGVLYVFLIIFGIGLAVFISACLILKVLVWIQRIWDQLIARFILNRRSLK